MTKICGCDWNRRGIFLFIALDFEMVRGCVAASVTAGLILQSQIDTYELWLFRIESGVSTAMPERQYMKQ